MSSARAFGITVMGSSGDEELVLCPFHYDRTPSAWFNTKKELFYCAVCDMGLNVRQLAKRLNLTEIPEQDDEEEEVEDYDFIEGVTSWEEGIESYHDYFRERGVSERVADRYGLRWKLEDPEAAVLPITNLDGERIGVLHRYIKPEVAGTRYKFFGKTTPVWPMHILGRMVDGQHLLVFEGAWSAMKFASFCYRQGYDGIASFALLGAKANQEIVDTLAPFTPIYLYDGDEAGERACRKMRKLSPLSFCWTLSVSPDDMNDIEMVAFLDRLGGKVV